MVASVAVATTLFAHLVVLRAREMMAAPAVVCAAVAVPYRLAAEK